MLRNVYEELSLNKILPVIKYCSCNLDKSIIKCMVYGACTSQNLSCLISIEFKFIFLVHHLWQVTLYVEYIMFTLLSNVDYHNPEHYITTGHWPRITFMSNVWDLEEKRIGAS